MLCSAKASISASEYLEYKSDEGPDDILNEPTIVMAHMIALLKLKTAAIALKINVKVCVFTDCANFGAYVTIAVTGIIIDVAERGRACAVTLITDLGICAVGRRIVVAERGNKLLRFGYSTAYGTVLAVA
jgi:hypothetical protein